ncbi:MAG: hypothetical protein ACJ768_24165 [Gaiellaceae bacterium]
MATFRAQWLGWIGLALWLVAFLVFHLPLIFLLGIGVGAFMLVVLRPRRTRRHRD